MMTDFNGAHPGSKIIESIKSRARENRKRIILNETDDERVLAAAEICKQEGIAEIIFPGNPVENPRFVEFADQLFELRKAKGMTREEAAEALKDPMYFSCMMVKNGLADGIVSGANHSTSDTLRPALQILKKFSPAANPPRPALVSAFFLMEVPDCDYGENGVFVFGDCGLNQSPTADELATIASDCAASFRQLTGSEPKVALLSHSTHGSAAYPDVEKVATATQIAKEKYPSLVLDGELQVDAALDPRVAELKHVEGSVAGRANVLIFPDLDSGNIAYKLTQYLAKAKAYGPITQGLSHPVNDLSRGCTVDDIVGVVAITAVQAMV